MVLRFRYKLAELEASKEVIVHSDTYSSSYQHCPLYLGGINAGEIIHCRDHRLNDDGTLSTSGKTTLKVNGRTIMYNTAFESSGHHNDEPIAVVANSETYEGIRRTKPVQQSVHIIDRPPKTDRSGVPKWGLNGMVYCDGCDGKGIAVKKMRSPLKRMWVMP